jgi:hypothetical protein
MAKTNNKWRHGRTHFGLPPMPPGFMRSAGVFYLTVTLDPEVGEEVVIVIFDPTDFIYQLAELIPFRFYTGSLAVNTSYGPVFIFLFWVTDPTDDSKVFAGFDKPVDISRRLLIEPWVKLRDQTHLHLFLVDANHEVQGFYEFENVYGFDEAIDVIGQLDARTVLNFDAAQREYFQDYNVPELIDMVRRSV